MITEEEQFKVTLITNKAVERLVLELEDTCRYCQLTFAKSGKGCPKKFGGNMKVANCQAESKVWFIERAVSLLGGKETKFCTEKTCYNKLLSETNGRVFHTNQPTEV
jgi:hypothetical protein